MSDEKDPNAQTQSGNGQTDDYKSQFLELSAKIANGEYVAKNVYTGLQTKHEKEVLAHKADVDALNAANTRVSEFETTLKTLQGQSEEFKTKFEEANAKATKLEAQTSRLTLIMGEFPELVSFEGKGLLPEAPTLDELKQKLTSFQETIGAARKQQKEEHLSGASLTPSQKNNGENATAAQLLAKAREFQRAGKYAEYNQTMNEYYAASKPA